VDTHRRHVISEHCQHDKFSRGPCTRLQLQEVASSEGRLPRDGNIRNRNWLLTVPFNASGP
jgi:hypothetical protein